MRPSVVGKWALGAHFCLVTSLASAQSKICQTADEIISQRLAVTDAPLVKNNVVVASINSRFCVHKVNDGKIHLNDGKPIDVILGRKIARFSQYYLERDLKIAMSDVGVDDNGATFSDANQACAALTLDGARTGDWKLPLSSDSFAVPTEVNLGLSAESIALYLMNPKLGEESAFGLSWTGSRVSIDPDVAYDIVFLNTIESLSGWHTKSSREGVICIKR
jgi:hypothetical protein